MGPLLDSSKAQRDRWGLALAGGLGLAGITLLTLNRPIILSLPSRPHMGSVETRLPVYDATDGPRAPALAPSPGEALPPPPRLVSHRALAWISPPALHVPAAPPIAAEVASADVPSPYAAEEAAPAPSRSGGLAGALRASGLACLGGRESLLSPTERELCREKLGALAGKSSSQPAPIAPDERAEYDAAARLQGPRRALVPLTARGAGNPFAFDDRARRRPRVGCAVRFGPDAGSSPGGCFVQPMAPPAPEADTRRSY